MKKWSKSNERRIYVNSNFLGMGDKLYLTEGDDGNVIVHLRVVCKSFHYQNIFGKDRPTGVQNHQFNERRFIDGFERRPGSLDGHGQ